jgi:hypothetical protein
MQECSSKFSVYKLKVNAQEHKTTLNLDRDLSLGRLVRKLLCFFIQTDGELLSLSKETQLTFHSLLEYHAGHHAHHYNSNLGKKKEDFTRRKQEEEGFSSNPFIWILDFGWAFHEDHLRNHANQLEFTFHYSHKGLRNDMEMVILTFYEDEDQKEYEFGWLWNQLESIDACNTPDVVNLCARVLGVKN